MTELILQAGVDHVARLAHESDPVRAVIELIWNAIDAEATDVSVTFDHSEMDAISKTTVTDDGHGIGLDELPGAFGRIGDSWKLKATKSKNGKRGLHGRLGEGRLRAFALGSRVEWDSHSRDATGKLLHIVISGTAERRNVFPWDSAPTTQTEPGTVVTIWNDTQKSLALLESDSTLSVLRSHFAPLLLNDDKLQISYWGAVLDPSDAMADRTPIPLTFGENEQQQGLLTIIEWRSGKHRALYYGPDDQHLLYEETAKDLEPQFSYSAYITWGRFDHEALSLLPLGDMAPGDIGSLWQAARGALREHFTGRRRERRRDQLTKWKKDRIYPYEGEPKTESEKAERAVFDVVSGTLSQQISTKRADAQLTLALLRDLRHRPALGARQRRPGAAQPLAGALRRAVLRAAVPAPAGGVLPRAAAGGPGHPGGGVPRPRSRPAVGPLPPLGHRHHHRGPARPVWRVAGGQGGYWSLDRLPAAQ
ncbi:ATP-binding protein [Streptomyces sp. HPF1205]|uniref:ATP-binding protein n=1 Tax=Streptomyces sp. HPF1205 TaxID=2873262 RepID=UPI001CED55DC|nr:ATP-binding protein [Streptomyces sp. HPF1205]